MPKATTTVDVSSFTTDAKFRTWGLAMSTAMAAAGFVKTADTGQIDWATVAKPTAVNTTAGYEIWRFNDTLQATAPIFIKIWYGSGGSVASGNTPSTWLNVATGSNGSGVVTGPAVSSLQSNIGNTAPSNTGMVGYFCHTEGYGLMVFGNQLVAGQYTNPGFYVIERTRDETGAPTAKGVSISRVYYNSATPFNQVYGIDFENSVTYTTGRNPHGALPSNAYSMATGNFVPLGRHFAPIPGGYPLIGSLTYFNTDIPAYTTFDVDIMGTEHTYLTFGVPNFGIALDTDSRAAFLWED